MNNWENQLKEAFDQVHMETELKQSVAAALRQKRWERQRSGQPWKKMAVALCLFLLVLTGFGGYQFLQPVHVISIDINPSIELGINRFDRVVSVDTYNDAGAAVSDSLSLRYLKSMDAVDTVLSSEIIQEHLSRQEELTLTVVGDDLEKNAALLTQLEESLGNVDNVDCHSTQASEVTNAHQCGLSYGKYLAYLEALEQKPELTPEEVQNMTMKEIRGISGHHQNHHGSSGNGTVDSAGSGSGAGNGSSGAASNAGKDDSHHNAQQGNSGVQSGAGQFSSGKGHHGTQGNKHHKGKH